MFNERSKEDIEKKFKDQVNTKTQELFKAQEDSLIEVSRRICTTYSFYTPSFIEETKAKSEFEDIRSPVLSYQDIVSIVRNTPKCYKDNFLEEDFNTYILSKIKEKLIEREMQAQHKYSKKSGGVFQDSHLPNLSGYIELYDLMNKQMEEFSAVTAADSGIFTSKLSYNLVEETIEDVSFPETHIIDILKDNEHNLPIEEKEIIRSIEANIVAISYGRGEAFGTGLLIHPSLVLTARHCIPEEDFSEIVIKKNYQKTQSGIMHFGDMVTISRKVEENVILDYAIIQLDSAMEEFKPITLELDDTIQEQLFFFHHPLGGPKKVSSHRIDQSVYEMLHAAGYYDTKKSSSGGVCVNKKGKIVALHSLGKDRTTDGKITDQYTSRTTDNWLKVIYHSSTILQGIYNDNGVSRIVNNDGQGNSVSIYDYSIITDEMISDESLANLHELEYNSKFEKLLTMQPTGYPTVNEGRDRRLPEWSYHHIIGKGDMEFLWMLAQESKILYDCLVKLLPQEYNYEDGRLTTIAVVWAPWNLFIGPTNRPEGLKPGFDPHNGYITELLKPISFPQNHWNFLMSLSNKISQCSKIRTQISGIQKEDLIDLLEPIQEGSSLEKTDVQTITDRKYVQELRKLAEDLTRLYTIVSAVTDRTWVLKPPYRTANNDWAMYKGQYKLRSSDIDASPAQNVMTITDHVIGAPLCIIAVDAPENLIAIEKFSSSLILLSQECRDSHSALIKVENYIRDTNNIDYSVLAFSAQQGLRFFPTIVYFFKIFGVDVPNIELSSELKGILDFILGTIKINVDTPDDPLILGQMLESGSYYTSLKTIEILNERPIYQQPTDLIDLFKVCIPELGNGLAAGVSLMSPSSIANGIVAGAAQCLSKHKLFSEETNTQNSVRIAIDLLVGTVSIYMIPGNALIKTLTLVNSVVMADITTKVLYSVYDVGVNDIGFLGANNIEHEIA